jgi:hypothetical protein
LQGINALAYSVSSLVTRKKVLLHLPMAHFKKKTSEQFLDFFSFSNCPGAITIKLFGGQIT